MSKLKQYINIQNNPVLNTTSEINFNEINEIVSDIKSGRVKPIYLLTGEEPYYIDKISDFIEENI